jgi:hypothetical protein
VVASSTIRNSCLNLTNASLDLSDDRNSEGCIDVICHGSDHGTLVKSITILSTKSSFYVTNRKTCWNFVFKIFFFHFFSW